MGRGQKEPHTLAAERLGQRHDRDTVRALLQQRFPHLTKDQLLKALKNGCGEKYRWTHSRASSSGGFQRTQEPTGGVSLDATRALEDAAALDSNTIEGIGLTEPLSSSTSTERVWSNQEVLQSASCC